MFAPTSRLSGVGEMMPLRPPMCPTLGGSFCLRSLRALGAGLHAVYPRQPPWQFGRSRIRNSAMLDIAGRDVWL